MPPEFASILTGQTLFFLIFALGALGSAIAMVLHPNPVRAALSLVVNLFCVAGLYVTLNAYFLAAVQIIVYAGAIMVLFLFVIMLLNLGSPDRTPDELKWQQPVAVLVGIILALTIGVSIYSAGSNSAPAPITARSARVRAAAPDSTTPAVDGETMGTVEEVGNTLYRSDLPWLFPFEVTSMLLLIAVIGSVVLAQRRVPAAAAAGLKELP